MRPLLAALSLILYTVLAVHPAHAPSSFQNPFHQVQSPRQTHVRRIAIIGAGAAGSSAAFHIANFSAVANVPVEISLFERRPYIGGRSTTVHAFNSSSEPVELGASIFIGANRVLMDAADRHGLPLISAGDQAPDGWTGNGLGIWNGERFVFTQKGDSNGWLDLARLVLRYGVVAPWRVSGMVQDTVKKFLRMYPSDALVKSESDHYFPWMDLAEAADNVGLRELMGVTGEELYTSKGISRKFWWEVAQAATRVNYAQNLGVINGFVSMVSMAPEGAVRVKGGNWQLFSHMGRAGATSVHLNTSIDKIHRNSSNGPFTLHSSSTLPASNFSNFDEVIIAGPHQFTNISFIPSLDHVPDTVPYVTLHVTLFTSPRLLSPSAFKLASGEKVPLVVLTSLSEDEEPGQRTPYPGKAGFFSISMLRPVTNPKTDRVEYLYKIFSPKVITSAFLANILGLADVPKSVDEFSERDVSWLYQKVWQSYPVHYPRVTYEPIRLAPNVWYTGGMDSFASCMETNALMGMNVARLIVDNWVKDKYGQQNGYPDHARLNGQRVLGLAK